MPPSARVVELLTAGDYAPLLTRNYASVRPLFPPGTFQGDGPKGLAVREDGKVLRMYTRSSYNNRFERDGQGRLLLHYVCGVAEELRRQRHTAPGAEVRVVISHNARNTPLHDMHAVLVGTFRGVVVRSGPRLRRVTKAIGRVCERMCSPELTMKRRKKAFR
jgi:hypothetical protein